MAEAKNTDGLVKRVVIGNKSFHAVDPDSGERFLAEPGDEVYVRPSTAEKNPHRLVAAEVAKAEQAAEEARVKAAKVAEEVAKKPAPRPTPTATRAPVKPTGGDSAES